MNKLSVIQRDPTARDTAHIIRRIKTSKTAIVFTIISKMMNICVLLKYTNKKF